MTSTKDETNLDIRETFYKLHGELALYFLKVVQESAEDHKASMFAVIAQFLRDNRITVDSITAHNISTGLRKLHVVSGETKNDLALPFPTNT